MNARPGWVFYASLILLSAFVGLGASNPEQLSSWAGVSLRFTTEHFGWLYLFATSGFLLFCPGIAASDYGHIRLGAEGEAAEFPYLTWLGMIFSVGMGVGVVFWTVAAWPRCRRFPFSQLFRL